MSGCNRVFQIITLLLQNTGSTPHLTCIATVVSWEKEGTDQINELGVHSPKTVSVTFISSSKHTVQSQGFLPSSAPTDLFSQSTMEEGTWWDRVTTQRCATWPTWKKLQHEVLEILEWNRSLRKETNRALNYFINTSEPSDPTAASSYPHLFPITVLKQLLAICK